MGDTFDPTKGQLIKAGGFVRMPTGKHHFAWAKGPTIVQVHGTRPFEFSYVNSADDPRNQHLIRAVSGPQDELSIAQSSRITASRIVAIKMRGR
jgi:hypothetical protein